MVPGDYPLFTPPEDLAAKPRKEWSRKEAKAYFDWFMQTMPKRIAAVSAYFGEDIAQGPERTLKAMGKKAVEELRSSEFAQTVGGAPTLTNAGYALAADMGLLVAHYLVQALGQAVAWKILTRPKSDISYNLPVLSGFGALSLDPIQVSISEAYGVLRGARGPDMWYEVYEIWKA